MNWLDSIRSRVLRPGESPEQADRRAFLLGATVTAAGLLVPLPIVSIGRARRAAQIVIVDIRIGPSRPSAVVFPTLERALRYADTPGDVVLVSPRIRTTTIQDQVLDVRDGVMVRGARISSKSDVTIAMGNGSAWGDSSIECPRGISLITNGEDARFCNNHVVVTDGWSGGPIIALKPPGLIA